MTVSVKIVEVPGAVREVVLEDGATVSDALTTAGMTVRDGYKLEVSGKPGASEGTVLSDGDKVVLAKGAKGNADFLNVKIVEVPGAVREVTLENGASVGDALAAAGMTVRDGYKLEVSGKPGATEGTVLSDGDKVVLAKGAKGNN